jgi:hypothetical protein
MRGVGIKMKTASANKIGSVRKARMGEQAQARTVVLVLISFLVGVAATAVWFHVAPIPNAENPGPPPADQPDNPPAAVPPSGAGSPAPAFVEPPVPVAPAAVEDLKRALPDYASLTVDEGTEILREAALKKYAAAAQELQSQVAQAQDELKQAQTKSPADQQAAMRHLQQVQTEQSQKLQQIGGQLQTQIAALKQLKGGR